MATVARASVRPLVGLPSTRMVEWSILIVVVLVIVAVAGHSIRLLQGQAERSTVLSTLGALRTSLVIAHLQQVSAASTGSFSAVPPNPFLALQTLPQNYRGEFTVNDLIATPLSGWVFDPLCACAGYVPLDAGWSDDPSPASALWFKVGPGPGPRLLTAQATYTWRGVVVQ